MDDIEQFIDQIRSGSDFERVLFYLEVKRASDATQVIRGLHREVWILEEQMSSFQRMLWRGLAMSVPFLGAAFFFDISYLKELLLVGNAVGVFGISLAGLQLRNRIQVLNARLQRAEMQAHYSYHSDEDADLKLDMKLWGHVRSWWSRRAS